MTTPTSELAAAYQACLGELFRQCPLMIERWCLKLTDVLYEKAIGTSAPVEKRQLQESVVAIKTWQRTLEQSFTMEVTRAIAEDSTPGVAKKPESGARTLSTISFDDLELMGDHQVQETLDGARLQQIFTMASDVGLAGLSARLSAAQGYKMVQADKNPLRPEIMSRVLLKVLKDLPVDAGIRSRWLTYGAQLMGNELQALYVMLTQLLAGLGVAPATYGVISAPGDRSRRVAMANDEPTSVSEPADPAVSLAASQATVSSVSTAASLPAGNGKPADAAAQVSREQLLTLDRLHRLMVGDYDDSFKGEPIHSGFGAFGSATRNGFSHTVPAAMDVLAELQQQGLVNPRNKADRPVPPQPVALVREQFKTEAKSLGQSVAIEVVGLMIEQLSNDKRLLDPIKQLIANAEPAFLRLAVTDPRFFSDKSHPARRLLDTITARSLAFSSEEAAGFAGFMLDLHEITEVLTKEDVVSDAQHFATLLQDFDEKQAARSLEASQAQHRAVQALLHAEQRNLLAEKIAAQIRARPDFISGNRVLATFLTGPWAQVMAREQLLADPDSPTAPVFGATLGLMLWSLNVEETSRHRNRLLKVIPGMLGKVREGLLSIDYPLADSKAFYDEMMRIHELALKSPSSSSSAAIAAQDKRHEAVANNPRDELEKAFRAGDEVVSSQQPWLAPAEARQSGFMDFDPVDMQDQAQAHQDAQDSQPDFQPTMPHEHRPGLAARLSAHMNGYGADGDNHGAGTAEARASAETSAAAEVTLQLGDWVELLSDTRWLRAQLTWISPHNTLFMFTGEGGRSHSMTARVLQHLLKLELVRVISQQGVLDGALDNVARAAVRNSVDVDSGF